MKIKKWIVSFYKGDACQDAPRTSNIWCFLLQSYERSWMERLGCCVCQRCDPAGKRTCHRVKASQVKKLAMNNKTSETHLRYGLESVVALVIAHLYDICFGSFGRRSNIIESTHTQRHILSVRKRSPSRSKLDWPYHCFESISSLSFDWWKYLTLVETKRPRPLPITPFQLIKVEWKKN